MNMSSARTHQNSCTSDSIKKRKKFDLNYFPDFNLILLSYIQPYCVEIHERVQFNIKDKYMGKKLKATIKNI